VIPPGRTSIPGRPDLAALSGRPGSQLERAVPGNWPVTGDARLLTVRAHQDQVLSHIQHASEVQRPPARPGGPQEADQRPYPTGSRTHRIPRSGRPLALSASSRRSHRTEGGSGVTAPPGPQSSAVTCRPSPGGRKRTARPLGGEHQPGRSPRFGAAWRSCSRLQRLVLVPAHFRGSLRC
jgi:hypothetical protein